MTAIYLDHRKAPRRGVRPRPLAGVGQRVELEVGLGDVQEVLRGDPDVEEVGGVVEKVLEYL